MEKKCILNYYVHRKQATLAEEALELKIVRSLESILEKTTLGPPLKFFPRHVLWTPS